MRAEEIDAPGALHEANEGAIEALRSARTARGLSDRVPGDRRRDRRGRGGPQLAAQIDRLLASDIIWTDSFARPRRGVIEEEGDRGLEPPTSEFVTADEVTTPEALAAIWQRIQGASDGGTPTGLHGSGISYVKVLPSGQNLSTDTLTKILVTGTSSRSRSVSRTRATARRSGSRSR